jgi:hypothetical protein
VIITAVFTIMVLMALVTTLMATPALALVSPLYHRGMTRPPGLVLREWGRGGLSPRRGGPSGGGRRGVGTRG